VFDQCSFYVDSKGNVDRTSAYFTAGGNKDANYKYSGFLITNSKVTTNGSRFYLDCLWKKNHDILFLKILNSKVIDIVDAPWLVYVYTIRNSKSFLSTKPLDIIFLLIFNSKVIIKLR
ncbi:hypothetical protein H8356DRAFT_929556, partial [Neocallimastix lanati (nom. inval.)]